MNSNGIQGPSVPFFAGSFHFRRGLAFGVIIIAALLAFEVFNYSTTDYALQDLLGDLKFLGVRWATILAVAFCGIDFAGIARLFTPEEGGDQPGEIWYLFGAWLLAATMNAMLTWWGVSLAVLNHETLGNSVIERTTLLRIVPIFVAVLVWLIRVLIIGTFSVAGDRLFSQPDVSQVFSPGLRPPAPAPREYRREVPAPAAPPPPIPARATNSRTPAPRATPAAASSAFRPAPKPASSHNDANPAFPARPEPTYHPAQMSPGPTSSGASASSGRAGSPRVPRREPRGGDGDTRF